MSLSNIVTNEAQKQEPDQMKRGLVGHKGVEGGVPKHQKLFGQW